MTHTGSLRKVFEDFIAAKRYQGVSPATVSFYRRNWNHFIRDTGVATIDALTPTVIRDWLLDHPDVTPTTLATYDRGLRVTLNWFEKRGYLVESPMKRLPKRRTPRTLVDTFSRGDVQAILRRAKQGRHPRRDVALVTLLLDTGLRIGEVTNLRLDDIDWAEGYLRATGKSGPRSVPFGRRTKAAIKVYVDRERRATSPRVRHLFLTRSGVPLTADGGSQQVSNIVRDAGVEVRKAGPHTFRHTFSVEFIREADTDLRAAHRRFAPADSWI